MSKEKHDTEQKTGTDVAERASTEVGSWGGDAGMGFENKTSDFIKVPFLRVLQGQSPLVLNEAPGAKAGAILNTGTDEIYQQGTPEFIAVYTIRDYIEWIPKVEGSEGGFVGRHAPDSDLVKKALKAVGGKYGKPKAPNGNDLTETFSVYGILLVKDMAPRPAIAAFSSTGIAHYQKWFGKADIQQGDGSKDFPKVLPSYPLFAFIYKLATVKEANKKGTYFNFELVPSSGAFKTSMIPHGGELYKAAKALYADVVAGNVESDVEQGLGSAGGAGTGAGQGGGSTEEIPF